MEWSEDHFADWVALVDSVKITGPIPTVLWIESAVGDFFLIRAQISVKDVDTGEMILVGGERGVNRLCKPDERIIWALVLGLWLHELSENYTVGGRQPRPPHTSEGRERETAWVRSEENGPEVFRTELISG